MFASINRPGWRDGAVQHGNTRVRVALFVGLMSLSITACGESAIEKAKRRHDWVQENGTFGELCVATKAVQEAYFDANDMEQFNFWHTSADAACANAQLLGASTPVKEAVSQESDGSR
ncbi:MAG: hypothetical protein KKD64_03570 [Alphaproteobacteria bacterium]|nr:hypothetical protein [Alphaproteobacteria bacterium]MBU0794808.1 hypothetical protein [Alphaproteobacteria bacterium]MBU0876193.1 hypothetical protein [Alphaproteobacteria bacterium]MBU1768714.1 hypothetical protein [Alphaproteobacteria bacterium]